MHEQCRTFQTWNDYKLRWSPEEYAGIKDIRYPSPGNIWKPDILLYNSADEKFDSTFPVNFVVSHNGDVLQAPPGIVKCSCDVDITWFPFDDQICFLKFGSWTYSVMKLDLQIDKDGLNETHEMDLQYYVENGEWILIRTPTRREEDPFAEEPYVQLYFYFHIRRRTLYYGLNWIIPSVLISLMTVLGFTLPPEAGEKITLGT
uniref:Neurotransmitter-gated ion-channel ligand-binding domain-containing protein n=1 Tax=Plectus sambesii TaxID=2011161 RepID=A0A914X532_9BILA